MFKKVGILGVGMVGGALRRYFEKVRNIKPFLYDKGKDLGSIQEINKADVIFICVPTPFDTSKNYFDSSCVEDAISKIEDKKIIVVKSTVLPGSTDNLQERYSQHKILHNPEFLTEDAPYYDMCYPDRQVIGYTKKSYNIAKDILKILPKAPISKIIPAVESEMVKYFANSWLSAKVIFANQTYDLCQEMGIDYNTIKELVIADERIGKSHFEVLHKGKRGYAGRCLLKDMKALIHFADKKGVNLELHKLIDKINDKLLKEQGIFDPENYHREQKHV